MRDAAILSSIRRFVRRPTTTIVQIVAKTQGISAAAANASVTASLGLPAGTDLTTLDAQTGVGAAAASVGQIGSGSAL